MENVATPHEVVRGKRVPIPYDFMDHVAPAGSINSNVIDMAQWMRMHLGKGLFQDQRILRADTVWEMQAMQIPISISRERKERMGTCFSGYGLGWGISDHLGHKLVTHGGGLSGMISYQALVPEKRLGVIVLTNFAPHNLARALVYWVLDAFLAKSKRDWSKEYLELAFEDKKRAEAAEEKLEAGRIQNTRPSLDLIEYTGKYLDDLSGETEIVMEGDRLVFEYNPRHVGDLEHWHFDTFRVLWRHPIYDMAQKSFLTFFLDETGKVAELEVTFYDPIRFRRIRDE
jgi:hypothetical protein